MVEEYNSCHLPCSANFVGGKNMYLRRNYLLKVNIDHQGSMHDEVEEEAATSGSV